jgi:phage terminase large subunit
VAQAAPDALKAMIDVQAERVVVVQDPEGAFAVRSTASKENLEALQGFHAEHLLFFIDEASGIPDIVFEVGLGALSTPGAKVVMAGNPTRTSGFFYDTHHSLRNRWHTMHVSCLDVPRAQGHIEDIRAKYGDNSDAWRVRVLGEFPTADDETVIPLELIMSAVGRNVSLLEYYPVWGLDVARFGDDRTALAKRQTNKLLEPVKWWNSTDLMAAGRALPLEHWVGRIARASSLLSTLSRAAAL